MEFELQRNAHAVGLNQHGHIVGTCSIRQHFQNGVAQARQPQREPDAMNARSRFAVRRDADLRISIGVVLYKMIRRKRQQVSASSTKVIWAKAVIGAAPPPKPIGSGDGTPGLGRRRARQREGSRTQRGTLRGLTGRPRAERRHLALPTSRSPALCSAHHPAHIERARSAGL